MNKVLLLVVEWRDDIRTQYAKCLVGLAWNRVVQGIKFYEGQRKAIWKTRQLMIEDVLQNENFKDFTHILFLDTDVIPQPDFLEKLLAHDKDVVSGYYCDTTGLPCNRLRGTPFYAESGLHEVDVLSMGYSLWKREVLEKVKYPEAPNGKLDADMEFCQLVKDAGYQLWTDFNLRGTHLLISPC